MGDLNFDTDSDFLLEKEGDVSNFFKPTVPIATGPRYMNGKIIPHSIIGPSSLFTTNRTEIIRSQAKKPSNSSTTKTSNKQSMSILKVDYQSRFDEIMKKINEARFKAIREEKEEFSKFTKNKQKIKKKPTIEIKKNFTERKNLKIKKNKKNTLSEIFSLDPKPKATDEYEEFDRVGSSNKLLWYMYLREYENNQELDTYMRVGPEINGLYTKVKKPNPFFDANKPSVLKNLLNDKNKHFEVVGKNKLILEVEAVKNIGCEYLSPELLENDTHYKEEIIEEKYDKKIYI